MPTVEITYDNPAPEIAYSSKWVDGTAASDTQFPYYFAQTFKAVQYANETATFKFYGTGIEYYGAKRWNHVRFRIPPLLSFSRVLYLLKI
jgi:hypothetical protein